MKWLFVSDLHYTLKQFDWVLAKAQNYDVVVIGGDLLDISAHVDGRVQIVVVLKYLKRLMSLTQLVVCSGNHDLDARSPAGEKVAKWMDKVRQLGIPADGDSVVVGNTLITVCPWWDGPVSRQAVAEQLARDAAKPKDSWIWVYHSPPEGSATSQARQRSFGDSELTAWIEQYRPDMVLSGHVHGAPFSKTGSWADRMGSTAVFNPGRQPGPIPTFIAIQTELRKAMWLSLAGAERVDLDTAIERPLPSLTELPSWAMD